MASIHGNHDGSFLFYPWMTSKKNNVLPKKHPSSCTTFSLYVRLSMNSFYCYTPAPHRLTRPCFPKASAKVDTFTVIAKRFTNKNRKKINRINLHLIIFNIFRRLNRVLFPAYPYMKSSRLTSHVFKASRIHGIPPQPQYLSETYPTENSH